MLEIRPSENDLLDHMSLINEAVKRDEILAKSKLLSTILEEKSVKRKAINEDAKPAFIVDDNEVEEPDEIDESEENDSDGDDDCFDSVCAICDNGGNIILDVGNQIYVATCSPARDAGAGYVAWGHSTLIRPTSFESESNISEAAYCSASSSLS